jgi:dTDP-4-amino-4,6-dideoxygalactose transaminase
MRDSFLPYCRPDAGEEEIAAVARSIRNGWLTTGPQSAAFEEAFAAACGIPHAVAVNSCTAALHLVLAALGVGPGDDVVMPSMTFAAGAECTLALGANPVFCDVEPDTFSVSVDTVARALTPQTKAVIAMPYAGRPLGVRTLCEFVRGRGIAIVEDAAHAAGMLDAGEWAGAHSDAAAYSFYATKNLATGEGGMLVTRDPRLAERVRQLSLHGMSKDAWKRYADRGSWRYDIVEPGFKYNITDVASSMGLVQLRRLPEMQARRDAIALRYLEALRELPGIGVQRAPERTGDRHAWCMFAITVEEGDGGGRDALSDALRERNVGTSVHYIPTHHFSAYRNLPHGSLTNTESLARRILSLPLYPAMSDSDVDDVIEAVRACTGRPTPA